MKKQVLAGTLSLSIRKNIPTGCFDQIVKPFIRIPHHNHFIFMITYHTKYYKKYLTKLRGICYYQRMKQ